MLRDVCDAKSQWKSENSLRFLEIKYFLGIINSKFNENSADVAQLVEQLIRNQ